MEKPHDSVSEPRKGRSRSLREGRLLLGIMGLAALTSVGGHAATPPLSITLGQSVAQLNGPWKFHAGDNPRWADPDFDDSRWETIDLTAPPGAHDDDVGLTGYVPGWGARGHSGYSGYAWYRLEVGVIAPAGAELALAGPAAVDSAYQVFLNGHLLGGLGRFSGPTPAAFSIQPRVFAIPALLNGNNQPRRLLVAFRVWMGPWELADRSAGGIHIAPVLGEAGSVNLLHQAQWMETFRGYVVEVAEATAFLFLAVMVLILMAFDRSRQANLWLCAALGLTALYRANQAVFFWGQFETVQAFEWISVVLLIPLCMATWTLAWRTWFRLRDTRWMPSGVGILTLVYVAAQFFTRSWFHGVFPHGVVAMFGLTATMVRVLFALLIILIVYRAVRQEGREAWRALPLVALISVGQFASELSALGIRGIWFPFGTGVSRTQYAYAMFDVVLFGMLLCQFLFFARKQRTISAAASR